MSLKGQHLEPLAPTSPEFLQYEAVFGTHKLVKLYKISYKQTGYFNHASFDAYPSIYYHGTSHCGCLLRRSEQTDLNRINAKDWCGQEGSCATQGILNHGHMITRSPGGHFFSPNWVTAFGYAVGRSGGKPLVPLFLVKARYTPKGADYCKVGNDRDIMPCYLAITRNT